MQTNTAQAINFTGDTDKVIELSLLNGQLRRATARTDSSQPDSLGDRLFRCSMNLSHDFHFGTVTQDQIDEAHYLLSLEEEARRL